MKSLFILIALLGIVAPISAVKLQCGKKITAPCEVVYTYKYLHTDGKASFVSFLHNERVNSAEILKIYVHPLHRKHGLGDKLLKIALKTVTKSDCHCITLVAEPYTMDLRDDRIEQRKQALDTLIHWYTKRGFNFSKYNYDEIYQGPIAARMVYDVKNGDEKWNVR